MFFRNVFKCLCIFSLNYLTVNGQYEGSIIFPATKSQRQRSFEILTSNAVSADSVVELSRAAEAFSLEYFQVNLLIYNFV